ncbi:aspartyl/asparaginyl beta-hydroxylase isoform X5 [Engraulis encrasicolus]|uniref:aspartyl/asparaginyl beta-hydroxylase isoform X5 n=1 Tax=Engraulis encrasicolus TaxID=184585 RepID=UPI002FD6ABA9
MIDVEETTMEQDTEPAAAPPPPPPPAASKNGKKSEGNSIFSWIFILALLGVWTGVGVVWFDLVDYDTVVGSLSPYDVDGDGRVGLEDAKVLLGLKEKPTASEPSQHMPVTDTSSEENVISGLKTEAEHARAETEFSNPPSSNEDSLDIDEGLTADDATSHLDREFIPFDSTEINFDSVRQDDKSLNTIDTTGELVVEAGPEETGHSDSTVLYSAQFGDQQIEEADPPAAETAQEETGTTAPPEPAQEPRTAEDLLEEAPANTESKPETSESATQPEPTEPEPEESAAAQETQPKPETPEAPAASEAPQDNTQSNTAEETTVKKKKPKMLNKFDKTIKAEIDAAEKLRKKGKAEEALRAFEGLVQKHPHSPRSRYGKAQSEDDLAEKMRSNEMLLKAVNTYKEAAELPDAPAGLIKAALKRRADRQQFLGRMRSSMATLQLLVQTFPEDIALKNDLGVAHLLIGDNQAAKTVYEEVLAVAPSDGFAKVHYGFILKSENRIEESIPYLRDGLLSGAEGTDDGRFYFHLGDALQRVGDQSAYEWYERGHKHGHFASVWQRSLYNVKGLRAQPWWTPRETGYTDLVKMLERNWLTIRDEALSVMNASSGLFVAEDENLREKGDWGQFTLWQQGRKVAASCRSVPKTCALLERYPEATGCKRGQIKFSVMQPGTHVWPHTGPTNCRLRMHLGLVIPADGCRIRCTDQIRNWEEGKVLIFDDSFEHEVWQDADRYRLIFIVDVWHPELSQTQRQTLSPI